MDFELIQRALPILLMGAGVTIEITAFSVAGTDLFDLLCIAHGNRSAGRTFYRSSRGLWNK